jgi:isopenicillin N synthase-like dioxygenase
MDAAARTFFARPPAEKAAVSLARGGRSWRGWFPLGDELTSGVPDLKEGYYVGRDLRPDHPAVVAGRLLAGPNQWPADLPELGAAVDRWMAQVERVGQAVLAAMAVGLGLPRSHFADTLTTDPTVLFRIFRYPPHPPGGAGVDRWGVAEHSDYGLVTLLAHDGRPGLEVHTTSGWVAVPADPDLIVCNLGDMLDRLTAGRYRSTPHRVRNHAGGDRLSFPFFLDPGWDAVVEPLPIDDRDGVAASPSAASIERWDRADLAEVSGTYGAWLTGKVAKVFPDLYEAVTVTVTGA